MTSSHHRPDALNGSRNRAALTAKRDAEGEGCLDSPPAPSATSIAKSLSEPLRKMVAEAEAYGDWHLVRVAGAGLDTRYYGERRDELRALGLVVYWNREYVSLTPLGRKVRLRLLK